MSEEGGKSTDPAAVVAAGADHGEGDYLRGLVGDREAVREVEMGDDSRSELSELESSRMEAEEEEEWEGKDRGRPNFARAAAGAAQQQSTQEFFRRGAQFSGGDNIFSSPGKTPMRGALARSLSAAASSQQQVGMAETLNFAKEPSEGAGMEGDGLEGSKGVEGTDVAADGWAEEMANQEEEERATTPTPTPARWATPTPAPVTPTKGSKRMALGTPKPGRHYRSLAAQPAPIGFAAQSALEQILGAVARMEKKMEEKMGVLEERMAAAMGERAAQEDEREGRAAAWLLTDAEEREKRLAGRLLALDRIETELARKGQWEIKQWTDLAALLERRRVEIREITEMVAGLAQAATATPPTPAAPPQPAQQRAAAPPPSTQRAAAEIRQTAPPPPPAPPSTPVEMEGVVRTVLEEVDEIVEIEEMEGVERVGLYQSRHAPAEDEGPPAITTARATMRGGKGKKVTPAVPRTILKCTETAAAEEAAEKAKEGKKKAEDKEEARKRWEMAKFTEMELRTYNEAANPIKAMAYDTADMEDTAATQRIAHKAGMRALEDRWELWWEKNIRRAKPPTQARAVAPQTQRQEQQQQQ